MEHTFTVTSAEAGERLDKWLCAKLPQFSRHQIKSLLDGGRVLVNRRRVVIAGWEVEEGDDIELRLPPSFERTPSAPAGPPDEMRPPLEMAAGAARPSFDRAEGLEERSGIRSSLERYFERQQQRRHAPPAADRAEPPRGHRREKGKDRGRERGRGGQARNIHLRVYHEDRDVIVVEKPAGLLSVPPDEKDLHQESLLAEIHAYLKRRHPGREHSFVAPLHRLDAETSGVMVFALSKEGQKLEHQFRDHSIRREYTAVVSGQIEEGEGIIDIPLEKGDFHGGKKVRRAEPGQGKKAVTEFRVKERYHNATLVELRVRTGRTHQIRVHLAEKGHPLLGDKLYADRAAGGVPASHRHALHAHVLGFRHPSTKKKYAFHSPIPKDLKKLIDELRESQ